MLQVIIIVKIVLAAAFGVCVFGGAVCGIILKFLSLGNQRWTNYGVNFWSPYPLQFWSDLRIIAERDTGRTRLLALVALNCMIAASAIGATLLVISAGAALVG